MKIKDWDLPTKELPHFDPKKSYPAHRLYSNAALDKAILLYNFEEPIMGLAIGLVAVLENIQNPKIVMNPMHNIHCFICKNSVQWLNNNSMAALVVYVYDKEDNISEFTILLLNFHKQLFSFIKLLNADAYKIIELKNNKIQLLWNGYEKKNKNRDEKIIDLNKLKWYSWEEIYNFNKFYLK